MDDDENIFTKTILKHREELEYYLKPAVSKIRFIQTTTVFIFLIIIVFMVIESFIRSKNPKIFSIFSYLSAALCVMMVAYYFFIDDRIETQILRVTARFVNILLTDDTLNQENENLNPSQGLVFYTKFLHETSSILRHNTEFDHLSKYSPLFLWSCCSLLMSVVNLRVCFIVKSIELNLYEKIGVYIPFFLNIVTLIFNFLTLIFLPKNESWLKTIGFYSTDNFICGEFEFVLFYISIFFNFLMFRYFDNKTKEIEKSSKPENKNFDKMNFVLYQITVYVA